MMNMILSGWKLQVPHAPDSPLDRIFVIGVCKSLFWVGYLFGENALGEEEIRLFNLFKIYQSRWSWS